MAEHRLGAEQIHYRWNNALPPVLEIAPGDVVHGHAREVTDGAITPASTAADLTLETFAFQYPLAGPIAIQGAEPGDALEVEILALRPDAWGWNGVPPGIGLLKDDFPGPYLHHWDLSNGVTTQLKPGIVIPLEPFCGVMGVAPRATGEHRVLPPGTFGGNVDIRHLTAGARLLLPVQVEGALFSVGDCHAVQGDGELCAAIECGMDFSLRFALHKGAALPSPQFWTRRGSRLTSHDTAHGYFATTGVGPDLYENARNAVRAMIAWLTRHHDLTPEEAYVLCCAVLDLKISEIVNPPNWIVAAYLPLGIFQS
ncbi:MAG: acetamidase/formamidase family protein [Thermomicrobiales bacterium]